jgi:hypothetical protein
VVVKEENGRFALAGFESFGSDGSVGTGDAVVSND